MDRVFVQIDIGMDKDVDGNLLEEVFLIWDHHKIEDISDVCAIPNFYQERILSLSTCSLDSQRRSYR